MGLLAETKSRKKISSNPNNTKWTRDTTTFGQKILRSQGWEPGQYLGVQNAPHSEMHSAASASYIRVALKDDMKGLGFDRAKQDEVTGLDVFSDLLSRLNGKSDDAVEEDKQARLVIKTHAFVERKYGPMRFVRGGLLVGDELKEEHVDSDEEMSDTTVDDGKDTKMADTAVEDSNKKSKKRKAASIDESEEPSAKDTDSKRQRKEERKSKKSRSEPMPGTTGDALDTDEEKARKKEKKERKREKKAKKEKSRSKDEAESGIDDDTDESSDRTKKRKSKSKDKKGQSKHLGEAGAESERKRAKKEKKRRKEEGLDSGSSTPTEATSAVSTGQSTPAGTGSGRSTPMGNRNFVRSRFIAQKKQAMLDPKALSQIFMIKT